VPRPHPAASRPTESTTRWSSRPQDEPPTAPPHPPGTQQAPSPRSDARPPSRTAQSALLETGRLWEITTELRPLLEQTARAGAATSWPLIRKRLPNLPRLHRDDECVILWLVDEDRHGSEPLFSALVTIGNQQMHPRFPAIADQHGLPISRAVAEQHTAWTYEVLKVHQHGRHRH
jgi:hypothetical protein